jgi:hypothetical protein
MAAEDQGQRLLERMEAGAYRAKVLVHDAIGAAGGDVGLAARALRIDYSTLASWRRTLPALDAAIRRAQASVPDLPDATEGRR